MPNYMTVQEADAYFITRLHTDTWTEATSENKAKALSMATEIIDQYKYKGEALGEQAFPRGTGSLVPEPIKRACAEIAQQLLEKDMEEISEDNPVTKASYGNTSVSISNPPEHLAAGCPSYKAWQILQPYLDRSQGVDLRRVS